MYYAGIGSRKTPQSILDCMTCIAEQLSSSGYILRSGGAIGADSAFEKGAAASKEIFRPQDATQRAIDLAGRHHPAWHRCSDYVRKLHGRNSQILLGKDLDTPVSMVICWTPNGKIEGGTGLGIRLAKAQGINVYNLAIQEDIDRLKEVYNIKLSIKEEVEEEWDDLPF